MSRQSKPKQFLDVLGVGKSLLTLTAERLIPLAPATNHWVVTSAEYSTLVAGHLPNLRPDQILGEPSRKNTAPCIAYAAYKLLALQPDAVMVICPADHVVMQPAAFTQVLQQAIAHAVNHDRLITIGIQPTRPDTGYGYIQYHDAQAHGLHRVKTFTEKPSLDLALQFLQSGDFAWNSGMFIWKVKSIIKAFETYMPDMAKSFEDRLHLLNTPDEERAIADIYAECPNISIDYGVMEQAQNVDMALGDFGWSDLGTWGSLHEQLVADEGGNTCAGGRLITDESFGCTVKLDTNKLAVVQGLENYIVVDTDDVLLICRRDEEQKIKQYVQDLRKSRLEGYL